MLSMAESLELYNQVLSNTTEAEFTKIARELCKKDLFFLLTQVCRRKDMIHPWIYDRVREVESSPDGNLDLWSRGHYKSTIITFGKTIQDVLNNPNLKVVIFSHTRTLAKTFLNQIKSEFEINTLLKRLFPDVLYNEPQRESPKWSLDTGLRLKRSSNPKEETIEASGIVDGQPTGKHYNLMVYDDVITEVSVSTQEQIDKTTAAWELSLNMGEPGAKIRYIGTRYHFADTYTTMMEREAAKPRIRLGVMDGVPQLWSKEYLAQRRQEMGPYVYAAQILLDPAAEQNAMFKEGWLRWYGIKEGWGKYNRYIVVDPANAKNKRSDYTAMVVFGVGEDNNYYIIDIVRDKLSLTERTDALFQLYREYHPLRVGYEAYGKDADIDHIRYVQQKEQFRFDIVPLKGANLSKRDRIAKLVPLFEQGRIYLPYEREILHKDYTGKDYYPVKIFKDEEYLDFPFCKHEDMLDVMSRMFDPELGARAPLGLHGAKVGYNKPQYTKKHDVFATPAGNRNTTHLKHNKLT